MTVTMRVPSLADVAAAARAIAPYARRTPLLEASLDGRPLLLKLEHLQRGGSFKLRGALNAILAGPPPAHVVTASGGNHGLGVATAASLLGVAATVYVPVTVPEGKARRIEAAGARLVRHGSTYAEAAAAAVEAADRPGRRYLPAYDDADVIAGQGTLAAEIVADAPEVDAIVVAVGGGGLVAGTVLAAGPRSTVAVEPHGCHCLAAALAAGHPVDTPIDSIAASALGATRLGTLPHTLLTTPRTEPHTKTDPSTSTSTEARAGTGTGAGAGTSIGSEASTGTEPSTGTGTGTSTGTGAGTSTGSEASTGTEARARTEDRTGIEARVGTDLSTGTGARAGTSTGSEASTGTEARARTAASTGTGTNISTEARAGIELSTGTSTGFEARAGTSAGSEASTRTSTGTGAGAGTSAGIEARTGTGTRASTRTGVQAVGGTRVRSVLVSDTDLLTARDLLWEHFRIAAEPAAAAPLAAWLIGAVPDAHPCLVICGANTDWIPA